jgi:hypothetical protein
MLPSQIKIAWEGQAGLLLVYYLEAWSQIYLLQSIIATIVPYPAINVMQPFEIISIDEHFCTIFVFTKHMLLLILSTISC